MTFQTSLPAEGALCSSSASKISLEVIVAPSLPCQLPGLFLIGPNAWEVPAWLCFESWHTVGHAVVKDVPEGLILPSNNNVEYHRKPRSSLLLRSLLQDRHGGREKQWQVRL